ncbi:hypothetical protein QBC39DRAFT_330211 [Podospora conica]|nr:hypothetical protein QBC39DRAFT_330211 [Schizothecium conicum]
MATPLPPTPQTLVHAYRHLLRAGLRAVQFSKPARYVVRDQLREGFRAPAAAQDYDAERIRRTVWFLKAAAQEAGLESRVLKSLVRVAWERKNPSGPRVTWKGTLAKMRMEAKVKKESVVVNTAYDHYDRTVGMLNDTMGLCLR